MHEFDRADEVFTAEAFLSRWHMKHAMSVAKAALKLSRFFDCLLDSFLVDHCGCGGCGKDKDLLLLNQPHS